MNYYFIGKLLNTNDGGKLNGPRGFLTRNIPSIGKVYNFNTKFAYLGYMNEATELVIKDKLNNMFEAIANKYAPQECQYTQYDITGPLKTKKAISILYENDNISNVIVPYIRSYTDAVFSYQQTEYVPHIAMLRFDPRESFNPSILQKTRLPTPNTFTIDSIDLLKGVPATTRAGPPSKYDDMYIKLVNRYPLTGSL